jgi:hypothetical protein
MTYQLLPGASVPTVALTFEFSLSVAGWIVAGLLCCGLGLLAWYASADWRASVTPSWWTLGSGGVRARPQLPESRQRSLRA